MALSPPSFGKKSLPEKTVKRIECGDALETLTTLPDNSVGAVISDPPFFINIGRSAKVGFGEDPWIGNIDSIDAAIVWTTPYMLEFRRILRLGGSVIIMGGTQACAAWAIAAETVDMAWMSELSVLWNTGKPRQNNFGSLYTRVLWFTKPGAKHVWNTKKKSIYSNVLVCKKTPIRERYHPAQKPIELTTFLISLLTKPSDTVLDPFCGSGSTLVSAAVCGRGYIGIDTDEEYCNKSRYRARNFEAEEDNSLFLWINGRLEEV